jgi:hypothetical protein
VRAKAGRRTNDPTARCLTFPDAGDDKAMTRLFFGSFFLLSGRSTWRTNSKTPSSSPSFRCSCAFRRCAALRRAAPPVSNSIVLSSSRRFSVVVFDQENGGPAAASLPCPSYVLITMVALILLVDEKRNHA